MLLNDLVSTSSSIAETSGRLEKIDRLSQLLKRLSPEEVPIAIAYLSGKLPQGRIGIGGSLISQARPGAAASAPGLDLREVNETFNRIAAIGGAGSTAQRIGVLRDLLG